MSPEYPDFPKEEFENRYARARALMAEQNIDALFITEKLNYGYFSGHRSCQNPIDKIRSYMFILPKDDDPLLITMPFEVMQVEQTTYIENIKTIGGLTGHPEFIVETLKSMGLEKGRIGAELGREQYLGTNVMALNEIMNSLSSAEFVDAAQVILDTRVIKSLLEIEYCRGAAKMTAEAEKEIFEGGSRRDDRERDRRQASHPAVRKGSGGPNAALCRLRALDRRHLPAADGPGGPEGRHARVRLRRHLQGLLL